VKSAFGELSAALWADAAQAENWRVESYIHVWRRVSSTPFLISSPRPSAHPDNERDRRDFVRFASISQTTYIGFCSEEGTSSGCWLRSRPIDDSTPRKYLGATARTWVEYLVAILLGNAIYYLSLQPHLPDFLRHKLFNADLGVFLDFIVCVGIYGLIRLRRSL
jgi:hypothetical protein